MSKSAQSFSQMPGSRGFPLVGDLPRFLPNPLPYLLALQSRHGDVFYAHFALGRKNVFVLGPELTEQVLVTQATAFSNELGYTELSQFLGTQALLFRDGDAHKVLRNAINPAFAPEKLRSYMSAMEGEITVQLSAWHKGTTTLLRDINLLTMRIAARTLVGVQVDEEAVAIYQHFGNMLRGMASVLPALPGTHKWQGLRSQQWMRNFFHTKIEQRRRQQGEDLFSYLCRADLGLADEEIVDNMVGILAASYETTASTIAMMMWSLAGAPQWQHRLREELSALLVPGGATMAQVRSCQQTEWVFKETLRQYAPLSYFPRRSIEAVQLGGYEIPANTQITLAPRFVHHMPSIYTQPEQFDPQRFSSERGEDKNHHLAWMPFGKGAHTCAGMHFAQLEIFIFFARLLEKFEIEKMDSELSTINYIPVLKPIQDLPVRLRAL